MVNITELVRTGVLRVTVSTTPPPPPSPPPPQREEEQQVEGGLFSGFL
jgi:hypothetical protein